MTRNSDGCESWYRWFVDNAQNSSYPDDKWLRQDGLPDLPAYTKACFKAGRRDALKEIQNLLIGFHNAEDEEGCLFNSEQLFDLLKRELEGTK